MDPAPGDQPEQPWGVRDYAPGTEPPDSPAFSPPADWTVAMTDDAIVVLSVDGKTMAVGTWEEAGSAERTDDQRPEPSGSVGPSDPRDVILAGGWTGTFTPLDDPRGVTAGLDEVWLSTGVNKVLSLDPATGIASAGAPTSGPPFAAPAFGVGDVVAGDDGTWVASPFGTVVSHLDASTNEVDLEIDVSAFRNLGGGQGLDDSPGRLATTPGALWVSNRFGGQVWRIDPEGGTQTAMVELPTPAVNILGTGLPAVDMAGATDSVWVATSLDVYRIDTSSSRVVSIVSVGTGHGLGLPEVSPDDLSSIDALAVEVDGTPWVVVHRLEDDPALLARIDPDTETVVEEFELPWGHAGEDGFDIAVTDTDLWITTSGDAGDAGVFRISLD